MSTHERPNLLLIMTDQHRWDHLGCLGIQPVDTPNIDRLVARGTRFSHCCTNSPVCAPARISLATGKHAEHTGALDNQAYASRNHETYYQRLRDADYRVGVVGKLDLAKPDPYNGLDGQRPSAYRWGFTHPLECEGKMHAGQHRSPIGPYTAFLAERGLLAAFHEDYAERAKRYATACWDSVLPTEAFEDHFIGQQSVRWLRERPTDFPWHLFVSFVGPHDPFDPPSEYADRVRGLEVPAAIEDSGTTRPEAFHRNVAQRSKQGVDRTVIAETKRQYIAAIKLIDDQIGEIIAAVEARGELDNTVVVFTSDHGEMLGDFGMFTKSVPYDGALRVPLVVAGPGIEAGVERDTMVELSDLNPTLCELAGLDRQPDIDARSFAPVLRGETADHREECLSIMRPFRLIRTRTHKLVAWNSGETEVYDLVRDPEENDNLAGRDRELERDLRTRLRHRLIGESKWRY